MKVKALRTFISGRISGIKCEIINIPEAKAGKLAAIGFIEQLETSTEPEKTDVPETAPEETTQEPEEKKPAKKKAPAKTTTKKPKK